jgi:hypothetical protein
MGISRRAYARRRGVSEASIRKHIANGVLAPAVLPDDTIDPDHADRLLAETVTRGAAVPVELKTARARRLRASTALTHDNVAELRRSSITIADAAPMIIAESRRVAARLRRIPDAVADRIAGQEPEAVVPIIRDAVHAALSDLSEGPEPPPRPREELDLGRHTPAQLNAIRTDLQGEELEYRRALDHGQMVDVTELAADFEERLAVLKSIITSIPGVVSPMMVSYDVETARAVVAEEVERAVTALQCDYVTVGDLR